MSLLYGLFLWSWPAGATVSLQRASSSLQWRLLLQSPGPRARGLQELQLPGSRAQAPGRAGFRSCSSRLQSTGSVVVVHRLSCSAPCGIFPDLGWNSCLLRWQEDASPLSHRERPYYCVLDCFLVSLYGVCIIRR